MRTLKIGFTGTKNGMDALQKESLVTLFNQAVQENDEVEFHHGDCIGADAQAARLMDLVRRNLIRVHGPNPSCRVKIVCHPGYPPNHPEETKYRAFTTFNDEVRDPKPFIARDHDIVDETDKLIAAPVSKTEETRSGTWTTVRYARKKNKPYVAIYPVEITKFDPHAMPQTNAVAGETNLYGPTHRQRGLRGSTVHAVGCPCGFCKAGWTKA